MSSLSAILTSALTSMQASQLGISVASNNISNAQDPNYTRQRLVTAPGASLDNTVNIGSGVQVIGIEAIRSQLIESRRLQVSSATAGDDLLSKTLGTIEVNFSDTDTSGLLNKLTGFFNSFQRLSTDPASANFREQVRTAGQSLASEFKSIHDGLTNTQALVNRSINDKVATINSLAQQIASLNGQIATQEAVGTANDLRDQRAALVNQLSKIVDVHELESNGTYQLGIGSTNEPIVVGVQTSPVAKSFATAASGELRALQDVRDQYIPGYLQSLDQLASDVVQQVNSQHSAGYDLNGNTGVNFFTPLSGVPGASAVMSLSAAVAANPSSIAASGRPTGQDNQNAIQLGNLLFQPVFSGTTVTDEYRKIVFNVGQDVSNAQTSLNQNQALSQQVETIRQSVSGVSIDEETVQVIQFQRAYQASARMIKTVDDLIQSVLDM